MDRDVLGVGNQRQIAKLGAVHHLPELLAHGLRVGGLVHRGCGLGGVVVILVAV
jgi:hypothetical protein